MKAIVCTQYGPPEVLQLRDVEKPVPKNNEVLIRIFATPVTASDCIVRGFHLPTWHPMGLMMGLVVGFGKPRNPILGMVLAGEIESIGRNVKRFKPGDQVYTFNIRRFGTYAEYASLPENEVIALKPSNLTYEQAAALPYGGLLALHFLRKGDVERRKKVLIYGASGAVGTSAVQLARYFGAEVTGVCGPANLELVRSLGAEPVIDYLQEDFVTRGDRYDLIFNAVGKRKAQLHCQEALTANGQHLTVDDGRPRLDREGLILLRELAEAGQLTAVIDRSFPLEQMVEAHRYVDTGHKKGNVVISVGHSSKSEIAVRPA